MQNHKPTPQKYRQQDIQMLEKTSLYQGFFKMLHYRFRHRLFAGGWSQPVSREIFERGHAVAVLPFDPVRGEFVMIEQLRIGAMATSESPWLLEVIAGMFEEGESPEDVCEREAMEEAGLEILHLTKAMSYLSSPGGTTERIHIYLAKVDALHAGGIHGLEDENEDILVHRVSEQEAFAWLEQGKIDNAATVIALQWFALNKQRLLDDWQTAA